MFEGPDRCGKSNIAKELSSRFSIPYFKNRNEFKSFVGFDSEYFVNTLRYAEPFFLDFVEQSNSSFVIDRSYPSEWCYSKLFNRRSDELMIWNIDAEYARLGTKIVIPHRTSYVGLKDDESCGLINDEKMTILDALYKEFAKHTCCQTLMLNVDDEDLDREVKEIVEFLDKPNDGQCVVRSSCRTCRHSVVWINHGMRGCYAHASKAFIDSMGEGCQLWERSNVVE